MKKLLALFSVLAFMMPAVAFAADFQSASLVSKDAKTSNLYVANQNVTVDAQVGGDLNTAGGTVTLNGTVEDNLHAAGGTVNIKGVVGKSAYVAGGTVNLDGNVGGDLVVFGGTVLVNTSAEVKGDLLVFGGTVTMNGKVDGRVYGSASTFDLNGTVAGNVELKNVGSLSLGSTAVVGGDVIYSSQSKATVSSDSKVSGQTKYTQVTKAPSNENHWQGIGTIGFLLGLIGSFILMALVVLIAPKMALSVIVTSMEKPWANIGIGLVAMIVTPILGFLVLITIVGAPVALAALAVFMALWAMAGILSVLLVGSFAKKILTRKKEYELNMGVAVLGVLFVALLKLIPVLGWLVVCGFFLIVFGQLTQDLFAWVKSQK